MVIRTTRNDFGLGWLVAAALLTTSIHAATPEIHPWPTGIQAILYDDPGRTGRSADVNSIQRIAGFQNRLFVALTDTAGHEILDLWDVRDVTRPVLVSSLDFGSVLTNRVMFTPLTLLPFQDGLLLQTRTGLSLYRIAADGRMAFSQELPPPVTGLGLDLTQLHVAERHASLLQQVIPNPLITGQNADAVHREVLVDLANPARPKLLWSGSSGSSLTHTHPINGVFGGNPASLAFDASDNRLSLAVFEPTRDAHHAVFWEPKLRRLVAEGALDAPLRDLIRQTLDALPLADLQAQGVQRYAAASGPGDVLIAARLRAHHADPERLRDVLEGYGIALDDPLEWAITKMIGTHLPSDLEADLARDWYAGPLDAWLRTLLAPSLVASTAAETRAAVEGLFNLDLEEHTLARYITLHIISPLLGDPDFMKLSLGQLLNQLAESGAGEAITAMLRSAGGFGAVNGLIDGLDDLLDWVPGVEIPDLPDCARFPDSTRQLIDLALFSWNDPSAGIALDRNGLAWFELLKFHRYLRGHTDFAAFDAQLRERLQTLQQGLAGNVTTRLSGVFNLAQTALPWPEIHARLAEERQTRFLIGRLIARAFIEVAFQDLDPTARATLTTQAALAHFNLNVRAPGMPESTIADLVVSLDGAGVAGLPLGNLFLEAAHLPVDVFAAHVEQVLRMQVQASFQLSDLDPSLRDLLRPCLDFDVGLQDLVGDWMSGLLADLLTDGPGMSELLLNFRRAFEHHDCIAGWLVALDAIAAATAVVGGDAIAWALEYALSEGYRAGVGYLIQTMFGVLVSEILDGFGGNQPAWIASQLTPHVREWTVLDPVPGSTLTLLGACTWQNRVFAVTQERDEAAWFGPRVIKLVICNPDHPEATRLVFDLGRWQAVNVVHHHKGSLFLGGSYFAPGDQAVPTGRAMVLDLHAADPRVQHLRGETYLPLASAPLLAGANHDAHLAIGGMNRISFSRIPPVAFPVATPRPNPRASFEDHLLPR